MAKTRLCCQSIEQMRRDDGFGRHRHAIKRIRRASRYLSNGQAVSTYWTVMAPHRGHSGYRQQEGRDTECMLALVLAAWQRGLRGRKTLIALNITSGLLRGRHIPIGLC